MVKYETNMIFSCYIEMYHNFFFIPHTLQHVMHPKFSTQRRTLLRNQSEEMKILNISFPKLRIEPKTCRVYNCTLMPLCHD